MEIHRSLEPVQLAGGCALALGYFDGLHQGHRAVIAAAKAWAEANGAQPAVFTFALPAESRIKGRRLLSTREKHRRTAEIGVAHYFAPPFEEIRDQSPQQFVDHILAGCCGARAVFCGEDFTFGKDRAGNVPLLRRLCAERGIRVEVVPYACYEGQRVSSTRIRAALEEGQVELANAMLGEDYCLDGAVHHGTGRGHVWGFPTVNQLFAPGQMIPRQGVYITRVELADGSFWPGATGLGSRPTVGGEGITCETFLPGFTGDIYGDEIRVWFCHYLKPTVRFDSVDQLKEYVFSAARSAEDYFRQHPEALNAKTR